MKKIISKVSIVLMVAVVVWLAWSFIDVNTHNNPTDSAYKDYPHGTAIILLSALFN